MSRQKKAPRPAALRPASSPWEQPQPAGVRAVYDAEVARGSDALAATVSDVSVGEVTLQTNWAAQVGDWS